MNSLLVTAAFVVAATAQVPTWGQCGGQGYTGSTSCTTGAICTSSNPWYFQCVPGTAKSTAVTSTAATRTTTTRISSPPPSTTLITSTTATRTSTMVTSSKSAAATSSGSTDVCTPKTTTTSAAATTIRSTSTSSSPSSAATKYFITFGDSYSQTGFDITGTKPSASNPLGNPALPGYTASGGLDWVGFMVTQFNNSLLLSYNLAYGGATTDADLVKPYDPSVLSFEDQVNEFTTYLASKPSWAPWTAQNTLVGVWIGVNDVGNAFYASNSTAIISAVVSRYFELLQTVYNGGARNFVLLSVPPTDKTPLMMSNNADSETQLRNSISQYNSLLSSGLASFKSRNSGVTAWIVDTSVPFNTAINNPSAYGAPDNTCFNSDGTSCLWFNNYHPGIQIQKLVAKAVASTVGSAWFTS